jgi:hypothetical protein
VRKTVVDVVEHQVYLPANEISDGRRIAFVWHVNDIDSRHTLEQFTGQMQRSAVPAGCKGEACRFRLGERDQFLHRLGRDRGIHHQYVGQRVDQTDGCEILDGIIRKLRVETRIDRMAGDACQEQRVSVTRGLGDEIRSDIAACSRTVFDHELLAQLQRKLLAVDASHRIYAASRGEGHHQFHRLARIVLGCREARGAERYSKTRVP